MKIARVPLKHKPGDRFDTPLSRAELRLRLLDTFDWCLPRAVPDRAGECLRSADLKPYLFNNSRYDSVNQVAWQRHCRLAEAGIAETFSHRMGEAEVEHDSQRRLGAFNGGSRLLTWCRDETIDDGVGEVCTHGYLDVSDMPPWDTWIAYVRVEDDPNASSAYLVSLVPAPFVQSVQQAIDLNAYAALYWLADSHLLLGAVLGDEGLLV